MMSYTASCLVSTSDCSASDVDTRDVSSTLRSRDRFGTRPYRTASEDKQQLLGDVLNERPTTTTHGKKFYTTAPLLTPSFKLSIQALHWRGWQLRELLRRRPCPFGGGHIPRIACNGCGKTRTTCTRIDGHQHRIWNRSITRSY